MKILFVVGSYPPETCGVGDYTSQLAGALEQQGVQVAIQNEKLWSVHHAPRIGRNAQQIGADLIHLQYPTVAQGRHLGPQAFGMLKRPIVTLHEMSGVHRLRTLSTLPFLFTARHVVFTSDYELGYARRVVPFVSGRASVIPIGSNVTPFINLCSKDDRSVVHFGLIRPNKGLERIIELARLIKSSDVAMSVVIIGSVLDQHRHYYAGLRNAAHGLPIRWHVDVPAEDVSRIIAQSSYAYLPFPDGVSERRGSLLAVFAQDAYVFTTRGDHTPASIEGAVHFCTHPAEVLSAMNGMGADVRDAVVSRSRQYLQTRSWNRIAQQHLQLYRTILCQ